MTTRPYLSTIAEAARIITALMLRDMRTRFGRNYVNYLLAIAWPLSHLTGIVVGFIAVNRILPFGTDSLIFVSSGALPYVLCLYPARLSGIGMLQNRPVLQLPIVRPLHMILARVLLEALSAAVVCTVFCCALWLLGGDVLPERPHLALEAIYASIFFGSSLGVTMMISAALFGVFGYLFFILAMIVLYLTSGVYVPITTTNETLLWLLSYNPIYHLVHWMRSAFYETHEGIEVSRGYILLLSAGLLAFGLAGERAFRGKILK
jgi:capsular polysaccharide transport system permease protein